MSGCTGITVSQGQLTEALERVAEANLQDRIDLVFCDYREVVAKYGPCVFDAVVSCEMIEAVGHEHLPIYFDIIGQALKPGGYFAMQVCTSHFISKVNVLLSFSHAQTNVLADDALLHFMKLTYHCACR